MLGQQRRCEARGDGDDDIRLHHAGKLHRLEGQSDLFCHFGEARQHLGMQVPADDLLELMRLRRRAQLELRLMARADHAEDLGVLPREMPDRHRGGRRGPERGEVIAAHHRLHAARVGVEQEHRRLVVDDPPRSRLCGQ
jgi:hypothetical protein